MTINEYLMLSVLIPVYNYNIVALVDELHEQLLDSDITFEIKCLDDDSSLEFIENNKSINKLSNVSYSISQQNNGREITRQLLAESAKYEYLLFLDADTMPCENSFIKNYLGQLNTDVKALFGGISYNAKRPNVEFLLRWTYGISKESIPASQRNKAPYRTITSPNFLIDKNTFIHFNSKIKRKDYGFDVYFASLLQTDKIAILHIDNAVEHLGIEKSEIYLTKSEFALRTYHFLLNEDKILGNDNGLLGLFIKLKRLKLNYVFSLIFKHFKNQFKTNLLGADPSITLFQFYRLSYLCNYDLEKSNQNQIAPQ